ncbi:cardiolipin synthase [Paenibacillus contaminans]|uniref:Cardiolipin synthase n=1 Tax=Paenibacillus contaminans TaxID=450362 RepID=A0A329MTL8_9BACL|nr:cardiolipin synthase [Paenibacillus contaminans]RAV21307.1 cardiolipin synthase [Paenibacillus contaminans]
MVVYNVLLSVILFLNIMLALVVVFLERRDIGTTWAWLLVLFFIPLLGFVVYLLFAQNLSRSKLFKWKDFGKSEIARLSKTQNSLLHLGQFRVVNDAAADHMDLIHLHAFNNHAIYTEDNQVELLVEGEEKFGRLLRDIREAKEHIHVQYYILKKDSIGKKLVEALTERARNGVKVKVLYDEMGSRTLTKRFFKAFREAGGEVAVFFPSRFRLINLRLNYRNHRKMVIIDGKIGYTGGFNVGDEYLGLSKKFGYWRDTHLRMVGTAVFALQTRFILDWNQASADDITYDPDYFPHAESTGNIGMQIVTSGPDSELENIKIGYIKMIMAAKKSVSIQTPYFIPDASYLDALRIASMSGVEVNIMVPNKPDHPFVYWATLSHIGEMLKTGANVYIYDKGFIHAKTIVVDEEISSVGTANIDVRSFKLNFEVNAFLYDKEFASRLTRVFHKDIEDCRLLTLEQYLQRSRMIRIKESVSRLLSPIL